MTARHDLLRLDDVHRGYGEGEARVVALDGVSLAVAPGELVAVMGASGAGKSTLLHVSGGLDVPDRGAVTVDGLDLGGLDRTRLAAVRRRAVGYVFQDLNLVSTLTLAENVALPLELDGLRRGPAREQAVAALTEVGVQAGADRFPDEVSGGQRQRAAIARALVGPRRLLLADEPTGALDSVTGEDVMAVLRGRVDAGAGGLLVTHDPRTAAWADRVVFLRDGRLVDSTAPTTDAAAFLGLAPAVDAEP
ncbi:ABC transporter ATP-binding protein [Jannaschia sp. R86511]|uniref:ABC transporter ATP-binding protein n=1 Tax=Jannaschia sp. R86511 TaxID=3093853 RepID=UPI0036D37390